MKRSNIFLLLIVILFFTCKKVSDSNMKVEGTNELPNIVLIIGDDQGYPYFGFMGADYVQTPHMDALAKSGTVFTNGYVPANHCRPSLQTLMTGTLPIDYNLEVSTNMNKELELLKFESDSARNEWSRNYKFHAMKYFQTLPKHLSSLGYNSFQGGKWWEFNFQNGGFDQGMTTGWTKEDEGTTEWFHKFMGGDGTDLVRVGMQPVYDFVNESKEGPFFIWFAPELPHYPFDAPDSYYNIYKDKDMSESAKRYYANCTWFDDGVGALMNYLKEQDEFDNTLFVYVNDNGWEQAPHQEFRHDSLRWHNGGDKGKLSMYDQSFRTPIIFSWKDKIANNKRNEQLIQSADIPATILDYVDIEIPKNYHGVSYKGVIEGEQKNLRSEVIGKAYQMRSDDDMMGMRIEGYWLRNEDWFFKWNLTLNTKELFNMQNDANNDNDLSENYPDLVNEYTNKLIDWKTSKGR